MDRVQQNNSFEDTVFADDTLMKIRWLLFCVIQTFKSFSARHTQYCYKSVFAKAGHYESDVAQKCAVALTGRVRQNVIIVHRYA